MTMTESIFELVRVAWQSCSNLVWPVSCPGCGAQDVAICLDCRAAVAGPGFATPMVGWPLGCGAWAAAGYRGVAGRMLLSWKERGRHDLTQPLAVGLGAALRACRAAHRGPPDEWLLVPVPSSRAARRHRGRDLMAELTRQAASACATEWPGAPPRAVPVLRHVRRVRDQGELGAVQRRANLRGALEVKPSMLNVVSGRRCVVVDDVVTTGTTAAEAARALTSAGARVVGLCFLCVTLRQQGVVEGGDQD